MIKNKVYIFGVVILLFVLTTSFVFSVTLLTTPQGGTGKGSFTAYSIITGGTTATGALQNVSGVGSSGQVLTSNGASNLPTWQNVS